MRARRAGSSSPSAPTCCSRRSRRSSTRSLQPPALSLDLTRFHESFFTESIEGLEATEAHLLALESGGEGPEREERLNAVFRGFHSIKGAAGSLGFKAVADFTHHVEEFLDRWRKGTAAIDRAGLDTILACIDHARVLLRGAKAGTNEGAEGSAELISGL